MQKCAVWGVVSNAQDWQFISIDEAGLLWRSKRIFLDLQSADKSDILNVYCHLHFLVKFSFEVCAMRHDLNHQPYCISCTF